MGVAHMADVGASSSGADSREGPDSLWIFGYGSLMWRPGFPFLDARPAELVGYRRDFCVYSTHHRGTADRPGLVLGLDRGGVCHGLAFRVADAEKPRVLGYLRAREQINGVYRETRVSLRLRDGAFDRAGPTASAHSDGTEIVSAICYVTERAHPSYCGGLPIETQARLIRGATGLSGPNIDYLANTLARAEALGLDARDLRRVMLLANPFFAGRPSQPRPDGPDVRPASRALVATLRNRRNGPTQPRLGERRRFVFRINREKAAEPGA
ncbi:MAG: gamma-glutamylcyclotransferase [Pseudomonadota bacterium]